MANEPALPPNSTKILVTGANGFVASHIVLEALKLGYHVRGTVRNAEKAEATKDLFQNHPKYSVVVVSDFATALTEIEHAVDGVESMIHVASDTSFSPDPTKVIPPVVNGILNVLRAAAQEPKVKRFTLTSSSVSAIWQKAGGTPENTITVDSWNDESVEKAWRKPGPDGWPADQSAEVYCASKVEGEKAFWKFVKEEKPHYVANTVLPNLNLGRILPGGQPGGSGGTVSSLYHNQAFPGFAPMHYINRHCKVAPCSRGARWIACEPECFAFADEFNWNDVIDLIKEVRPDLRLTVHKDPKLGRDLTRVPKEQGSELLQKWFGQIGYTSLKQSVKENLDGIV